MAHDISGGDFHGSLKEKEKLSGLHKKECRHLHASRIEFTVRVLVKLKAKVHAG